MQKSLKILLGAALLLPVAVANIQTPQKAQAAKPAAPAIHSVSPEGLRKVIAARKGRPVVVNFWATWCGACREEFPSLVKLQKTYAKRGLAVIFVSLDDAADKNAAASYLKKQGALGTGYIGAGDPVTFIPRFDPSHKGAAALPMTYIYGKNGKVAKKLVGGRSYSQFEAAVKPHL
jgi:thiol-disulfide isomerase/thioredoxin